MNISFLVYSYWFSFDKFLYGNSKDKNTIIDVIFCYQCVTINFVSLYKFLKNKIELM